MPDLAIRTTLRFILNGEDVALTDVAPDETLLDFLRLRRSLMGTKEGCAEGDCGACTVLVGRLASGNVVYESVNACIRFLGSLDAQHVVTVEHLKRPDGSLHPVQQAMVDFHGSQCGFCTPGFVMSLYGLWMRDPDPSEAAIEKALQGNLCRCTGYESIVRAAKAIHGYGNVAEDALAAERGGIAARLSTLKDGLRVEIGGGERRLIVPASVDDLAEIYESLDGKATIVSGSTDVGLWVTKFMRDIAPVIFIGGLDGLRDVSERDGAITLGAGVSYTVAFETLANRIPAFGRLIDRIGGEQVRNMGTIGGNVANGSPIGDMPPPLIALGATLNLRKGNARRTLPLESYFLDYGKQDRKPGEFVESVTVPLPERSSIFKVYKVTKRLDEDITAAFGAFHMTLMDTPSAAASADKVVSSVRIAYGGMAATPKRAKAVEAALTGEPWTEETVQAAMAMFAQDFKPLTDMRASADYRALVSRNLLLRFYLETTAGDVPVTVSRNQAA